MFKSFILFSTFLVAIALTTQIDDTEIIKEIQVGHHNLAINLHRELCKTVGSKENVLTSPVDVHAAMTLVLYPSRGETRKQLLNVMGLSDNLDFNELNWKIASLIQDMQHNNRANCTMAEGMFIQNGFEINEAYKQYIKDTYKGEIGNVDFAGNGQEAANTINKWITDRTGGRVREMCETPYSGDTVAVLANAMYFQGNFENRFKKSQTQNGKFNNNDMMMDVKYMEDTNEVKYCENNEKQYKAIGLPFEDKEFTLYYLLPNENTQVQNVLNQLNSDDIRKIINGQQKTVNYKIPKMELECKNDLGRHLQTLGVQDLFTNKAELDDLAVGVKVSKINDKVELKINENGASGSSATTVDFKYLNKGSNDETKINFEVNRPFICLILHERTNLINFLGVVNNPNPVGVVPVNRRNYGRGMRTRFFPRF